MKRLWCKISNVYPSIYQLFIYSLYVTGLIDYNFWCFRQGIQDVFDLRKKLGLANGEVAPNGLPEIQKDT